MEMKKIINVTLSFLLVFFFALTFGLNVKAETENVSIDVTLVKTEDVDTIPFTGTLGQQMAVDFGALQDEFAFFIHEGNVINDLSTQFVVSESNNIIAVLQNVEAVYIDTNGAFLGAHTEPTIDLSKPGYVFNTYVDHADNNVVKVARYNRVNTDEIILTINGGIHMPENPVFNQVVTLEPTNVENFSYWADEDGQIVSTNPNYTFTAMVDLELTAVHDETFVNQDVLYLTNVTGIRDNYLSFLGHFDLLEDKKAVEYGLLASNEEELLTLDSTTATKVPSTALTVDNEFLRSFPEDAFKTFRAYAILDDNSVLYSENNFLVESVVGESFVETFDNMEMSGSSYGSGSHTGANKQVWSYTDARGDQAMDGKALLLRKGSLTTTFENGLSNISFDYDRAFPNDKSRSYEIYLNGELIDTIIVLATANDRKTYNSGPLNYIGTVELEIKGLGAQKMIDNVAWTEASQQDITSKTIEVAFLDGDLRTTKLVSKNETVTPLEEPAKDGFTFLGWYLEGTEEVFDFDTEITESITLEARWKATQASVTTSQELKDALLDEFIDTINIDAEITGDVVYNIDRSVTIEGNENKLFGTFIIKANDVTINNLHLENKGDEAGTNTPNRGAIYVYAENITLTNNTFTTTLDGDGIPNGIQIMTPVAGTPLSNYVLTNNTFDGYINEEGKYSSTAILFAQEFNSGTVGGRAESMVATNADYEAILLNNTIVNFALDLSHTDWTNSSQPTIYPYTITFDSNGGSEVTVPRVHYNHTAEVPETPTKAGHTFVEWQLDGETFDFNMPITESITLVAVWEIAPGAVVNQTKNIAYSTIQEAINEADDYDVILVAAGTFEKQLTIDKPLTLLGPNKEVVGAGTRNAEAILTLPAGLEDGYYQVISITSDDVTIEGFKLFEDVSVAFGGYQTVGIQAKGNNIVVRNNIFDGFNRNQLLITSQTLVDEEWINIYKEGALVEGNLFENSKDFSAIYLQGTAGTVQNNVVLNAAYRGIQIQPYSQSLGGTVSNNEVQAGKSGLYYNSAYAAGSWLFEDNEITAADLVNAEEWHGISIQGFTEGSEVVTFRNNSIDGLGADRNEGILTIGIKSFTTFEDVALLENNIIANVDQEFDPIMSQFTVTFDTDGGSVVDSQVVVKDGFVIEPEEPTKEGYTFVEWQLDGETFDFETPISESFALVAVWEEIVYDTIEASIQYTGSQNGANQSGDITSDLTITNPVENAITITYIPGTGSNNIFNNSSKEIRLYVNGEIEISVEGSLIIGVSFSTSRNDGVSINGGSKITNSSINETFDGVAELSIKAAGNQVRMGTITIKYVIQ